jgi:hypothetical protein
LAPDNADHVLTRANLLQSSGRFGEAREAYRRALDLGADRRTAGSNLELSTELERVQSGQVKPKPQVVERLSRALHAQKRGPEVIMLDAAIQGRLAEPSALLDEILADGNVAPALQPLLRDLGEYTSQSAWNRERLYLRPDGSIGLNLAGLSIASLSGLRGHDVVELDLTDTDVTSLDELRGVSLRRLVLRGTSVDDLGPLAAMPLEDLACSQEVSDLEPLRGMPLKSLDLSGSKVASLEALRGMPLSELRLDGLELSDLEPLRGMPLQRLHLNVSGAMDFGPVATLSALEFVDLPPQAADFDPSVLPALREVLPRHLGISQPIEAAKLQEIVAAQRQLWERHGRVLELMKLKDMGPHRLMVRDPSGEFDLDLRGTGVVDLKALRSMPVRRLFLDSAGGAPLDVSALADHATLRHVIAVGARIADIAPLASLRQLETIALSPDVENINLLNAHPSLRRIGYQLDETGSAPKATAEEFFGPRIREDESKPRAKPVAEFLFDNAADGAQGWRVMSGEELVPRGFWVSDPVAEGGRGGGLFAFYERTGDSKPGSFVFSPRLELRSQRLALSGGMLEFEIRMHELEEGVRPGEISVTLVGTGGRSISCEAPAKLGTEWSIVSVPLDASVMWTDRATLYRAQEEHMKGVLGSLREVIIQAEFTTGLPNERTDIDNVRLWDSASAVQRTEELRRVEP